jgi:hypothetical protein
MREWQGVVFGNPVAKLLNSVEKLHSGLERNRRGHTQEMNTAEFQRVTSEHLFRKRAFAFSTEFFNSIPHSCDSYINNGLLAFEIGKTWLQKRTVLRGYLQRQRLTPSWLRS